MRNLFLMLGGVALFIGVVGLLVKAQKGEKNVISGLFKSTPALFVITNPKEITVHNSKFNVFVAANNQDRQKGLSGVSSLKENEGMLFVFESKNIMPTFWMKDMLIPLDFIWINDDKVVEINQNILPPSPNTPEKDLKTYAPSVSVDYVLEVNAGTVTRESLKVGDGVNLSKAL